MGKPAHSPTFTALIIALVAVAATVYFNHKKDRELIALNESKSKLTTEELTPKENHLKEYLGRKLKPIPSANQTVLLQERIFTEAEIQHMNQAEFLSLLNDIGRKLPKTSDLKKIPAQALHTTPPLILEAGRNLGLIKEILKIHESFELMTLPFYQACAQNAEGVTPIRALCLTNLIELNKKNGRKLQLKDYPQNIINLSKMVTEN